MIEIRFHGRGGQGAVTAAEILANASFLEGKYVKYFPEFGIERRGAPVTAFLRVDNKKILLTTAIDKPDIVVIFDVSLMQRVKITLGLKEQGWLIINSPKSPTEFQNLGHYNIATVDGTNIALKQGIGSKNQPIVNTVMTGTLAKILGISFESLKKAMEKKFGEKAQHNIEGAKEAYDSLATEGGNEK